jgi:hypothetical protein
MYDAEHAEGFKTHYCVQKKKENVSKGRVKTQTQRRVHVCGWVCACECLPAPPPACRLATPPPPPPCRLQPPRPHAPTQPRRTPAPPPPTPLLLLPPHRPRPNPQAPWNTNPLPATARAARASSLSSPAGLVWGQPSRWSWPWPGGAGARRKAVARTSWERRTPHPHTHAACAHGAQQRRPTRQRRPAAKRTAPQKGAPGAGKGWGRRQERKGAGGGRTGAHTRAHAGGAGGLPHTTARGGGNVGKRRGSGTPVGWAQRARHNAARTGREAHRGADRHRHTPPPPTHTRAHTPAGRPSLHALSS